MQIKNEHNESNLIHIADLCLGTSSRSSSNSKQEQLELEQQLQQEQQQLYCRSDGDKADISKLQVTPSLICTEHLFSGLIVVKINVPHCCGSIPCCAAHPPSQIDHRDKNTLTNIGSGKTKQKKG